MSERLLLVEDDVRLAAMLFAQRARLGVTFGHPGGSANRRSGNKHRHLADGEAD